MYRKIAVATALAALALPAAAQAHVTVQPKQAEAGTFAVENIRVPNERDNASTVKVDVQMPAGLSSVSYQPVAGWKVKVTKTKLATAIKSDDGEITEGVSRVTFTGDGKTGKIAPGEFQDFLLSFQIPGEAGDSLTFKALQTYSNGEVVRWIGAEGSDEPAPTLSVMAGDAAAAGGHHGGGADRKTEETTATAAAPASDAGASDDGKASQGLAIAAVLVGGLGLLVGGAALLLSRRRVGAPARS
jgi:uncharacterized protein